MSQEIIGELKIHPNILEVMKADPRFVALVKSFVEESAALTVRIANEMGDVPVEDALKWNAQTLGADEFLVLSAALGVVLNNSFYYADYSDQSWGYTAQEILGSTAYGSGDGIPVDGDGKQIGDWLGEFGTKIDEMMEDGPAWPA